MTSNDPETTLWNIVEDVTFCMFVTHDGTQLRSRPMTLKSEEASGEFQFLAAASSSTVAEIGQNPAVNLTFSDPGKNDYVSVSGVATVGEDRNLTRKLWSAYAGKYFGGGPDTADVTVIRVKPERAEYWDGESRVVKQAWNFVQDQLGNDELWKADNQKLAF